MRIDQIAAVCHEANRALCEQFADLSQLSWDAAPDPIAKTHPCLVPYGELPPEQKAKDELFLSIVRALAPLLMLLVFFFPALAWAQAGVEPQNTTELVIGAVLAIAVPLFVRVAREWWKDRADSRLGTILNVARMVFWLTEEAKRLWPDKVPNALTFAEAKFIELLQAQGITPTPAERVLAKASWAALHGEGKVMAELASARPS